MLKRAYKKFSNTIDRSVRIAQVGLSLRGLHYEKMETDFTERELGDLFRAAIVMGVAALDAYATDKFVEMLVPFLRSHGPTKGLIVFLERAGLNTSSALVICTMQRPFARIRLLALNYLEKHVTQRLDKIDELFLPYGITKLSQMAVQKSGKPSVSKDISRLVNRRHRIVHDGDYNKRVKLTEISGALIVRQLDSLLEFVYAAELILNERLARAKQKS